MATAAATATIATQAIVTNTRTADTCYYVFFGFRIHIEMGALRHSDVVVIVGAAAACAARTHFYCRLNSVYFVNLLYFIIISVFTFNVSVSIFLSLWVWVGRTHRRPLISMGIIFQYFVRLSVCLWEYARVFVPF